MSILYYTPTTIVTSESPLPIIPTKLPSLPLITPIITTINPLVNFPLHPSLDLNRDKDFQNKVTKYFYYKTLDKWLKKEKDMLEILKFLKIVNGEVKLISNMNEYNQKANSDKQDDVEKKVKFIEDNILSKDDVNNILRKYVKETTTNWYDLQEKATYFIKEIIKKFLKHKLKDAIEGKTRRSDS